MRQPFLRIAFFLGLATAAACSSSLAPVRQCATAEICVTGTVRFFNLEGGFWAIRGDDSVTYDPINALAEDFRHDGLRVHLRARERTDVGSFHMVGPIVEIISIARIP